MIKFLFSITLIFSHLLINAQFYKSSEPFSHTYSIVAIDPETGDMGAAVQSHWFSVGSLVIYKDKTDAEGEVPCISFSVCS